MAREGLPALPTYVPLVEGPEQLSLGSRITVQGRRWGIPQRIVSEVTAFEPNVRFVDEQRQGPRGTLNQVG